ncbi:MAG: hypothetical protein MZW92_32930 [Comamonadaceae bacterium]|nr:hypothetical protein [Comamonadaceae bacterium]
MACLRRCSPSAPGCPWPSSRVGLAEGAARTDLVDPDPARIAATRARAALPQHGRSSRSCRAQRPPWGGAARRPPRASVSPAKRAGRRCRSRRPLDRVRATASSPRPRLRARRCSRASAATDADGRRVGAPSTVERVLRDGGSRSTHASPPLRAARCSALRSA